MSKIVILENQISMDEVKKLAENSKNIERDSLFYMANLYPEIGRMFSYFDSGKSEASINAQKRALGIVEQILSFKDIKPAGREEWSVIRNFILGYDKLDSYERRILEKYAEPFSYKFMANYSG